MRSVHSDVVEKSSVVQGSLTFNTNFGKSVNRLNGELSDGSFIPENKSIDAVNNSLNNIGSFSASRGSEGGHGVEDLGLHDNGFCKLVTLLNDPILSDENFFS